MKKLLQISHNEPITKHCQTLILLMLALLSFCSLQAQPPVFTLTVTPTTESCLGNGTLTFNVTGTDPAATVEYTIYQLPDTANPIAVQTSSILGGRTSGDYLVVATQTLNGQSNTQTQTVTITNTIVPLSYTVTSTHSLCGNDATITVTIDSGVGAQYEIISGPVTAPLQTSPVFSMVPAGVYEVRVFDNCGVGWVVTHTVISDAAQVNIGGVTFPNPELPSCNTIVVGNLLTPSVGDILTYPMYVKYTIHPPSGPPVIIDQTISSGAPDAYDLQQVFPFYYDQLYTYDIVVTDHCGNVYQASDAINQKLLVVVTAEEAKCGQKFLMVRPAFYTAPITITFLAAPPGFDPAAFNPAHPGPFSSLDIPTPYGDYNHPVPFGTYTVQINDGCGHTAEYTLTIVYVPPTPVKEITPYVGCQSDRSEVKIKIPGYTIVSAVITAAPATYPNPIPDDVSAFIQDPEGLVLNPLFTGNYTVHLVDDCGNVYDYDFFVPGLATSVTQATRNDCETGKGTIRIRGSSTSLTSAVMTSAPAGFPAAMPYDVSFNLTPDGIFSMAGLIPGNYSFDVTDSCGLLHTINANIVGYAVTDNNFSITPHCGSFDFSLAYTSTANGQETFWLQKYDPVTNTWGHPDTGVVYPDGTPPNTTNSFPITNNTTTLNLTFTGTFRIIKRFESFENGSVGEFKQCIETIQEFEYTGIFEITGFEKVTCSGAFADVKVLTNGVPPMTYKIIKKNGVPFLIDNGNNNIFTNLEQAVYTFQVQHSCGHIATGDADVAQLPSLATATQPADLEACDDISNDGLETFDLSAQDAVIFGSQNPADYTLSYHLTLSDATLGINPLPTSYVSGNQTIYVRLKYNNGDCFDTTSFHLIVHPYPVPDMRQTWGLCENTSVTITAPAGYDHYLWSTGAVTQSITVSQGGPYTLTVTQGNCQGVFPIDVIVSNAPVIDHIDTTDWTPEDNSITVILTGGSIGNYVFSIDGTHYQSSNVFDNLPAGQYTVYVKDLDFCGSDDQTVFLLNYPRYFTPNGDGFHDFWKVRYSEFEPHLMTYIFDRYGKLITGFLPNSPGWDGTYNGNPLPSTDYWFLVIRENGKELRGHFAMKR